MRCFLGSLCWEAFRIGMAVAEPHVTSPWQPLAGQVLFISVHRRRINESDLQKYIHALGGKVESFFSNEITCVLTDEISQPSNEGAQRQTSSMRNIVAKAEMLGIQIMKIECFMTWLHVHAGFPTRPQQASKATTSKAISTNKVTKLNGHFLKLEDDGQKYCPVYKVFPEEPKVEFEDLFLKESEYDVIKRRSSSRVGEVWKNTRDANFSKLVAPKDDVKLSSSISRSKPTVQRQSRKYCECCKMYFSCLEKHLKGPRHTKFLTNQDNFRPLEFLSNDVPDIVAFQKKQSEKLVSRLVAENLHENSDNDEEGCEVKLEPNILKSNACNLLPSNLFELPLMGNHESTKDVFSYKTKEELDFRSFLGSDILPDNERLFTSDDSDDDNMNKSVFRLIETALQDESLNNCDLVFQTQTKAAKPDDELYLQTNNQVPDVDLLNKSEVPSGLGNNIFMEKLCLPGWSVKPISDIKMSFLRCSVLPSLDIHMKYESPKEENWRVKMVNDTKMTFAKVKIG